MKKLLLLILIFLLTGCQSLTNPAYITDGKPLGNHYLSWNQRQQQLQALTNWSASGSIAAQNQIKGGWSASFNWQQQANIYSLAMFGPFGSNRIEINSTPSYVTLKTSEQTFSAQNPEILMQQQLGWQLPVSDLPYWLRGLPAPYSRTRHSLDMNNHIVHLIQDGWNIYFLRYVAVHGVDVPDRILLTKPPWVAHIIVHQWQL